MRDLATMLIETGEVEEGFEVYDQLLQEPTTLTGEDLYAIGVGFYQGNAYDRAANAFMLAGDKNRYDRDSIELWARSLQLDSAYAEVPEAADRWIELDPSSVTAYLVLAQAVNSLEDTERTGEVVRAMEALEVDVSNLSLTKYGDGGARITGQVMNRLLDAGTQVTLTFTFYSEEASPVGTLDQTVAVGEENMAEIFAGEFDSPQIIGGYSYELRVN
jgi:tetratricopeptide (TPR) repeat protein